MTIRALWVALCFLFAGEACATLYVRPTTDCPLNGNGTAYGCAASGGGVGAWRAMTGVVQATPAAGETVKTCGDFTVADADNATVMLVTNWTNANVATDGDCTAEGGRSYATWDGGGLRARGADSGSGGSVGNVFRNIRFKGFTEYPIIGQNAISKDWLIEDSQFDCALAQQCVRNLTAGMTGWVVQDSVMNNCADDCIFTVNPMTVRRVTSSEWSTGTVTGDFLQSGGTNCDGFLLEDLDLESSKDIKQAIIVNGCTGAVNVTVTRGRFVKRGQSTNLSVGFVPLFFDGTSGTITVRGAYVAGGRTNLFVGSGVSLVAEGNVFGPATTTNVHCGTSTVACTVRHNTIRGGTVAVEMASAGAGGLAVNNALVGVVGVNRGASGVETNNTIIATTPCQVGGVGGACDGTDNTGAASMRWIGGEAPDTAIGYCPASTSPLLNAGTYIGPWITDYFGVPFDTTPNIGAMGDYCAKRAPAASRVAP